MKAGPLILLLGWLSTGICRAQALEFGDGGGARVEARQAHRLDFRFQSRYPHAYSQTLVQGSNFWLGLGDDNAQPSGSKLEWRSDLQRQVFPVDLKPDQTYQLALRGRAGSWTFLLNGKRLGEAAGPTPLRGPFHLGCGETGVDPFFGRLIDFRCDNLGWSSCQLRGGAGWFRTGQDWPVHRRHLRFPFPDGQIWNVIQGFSTDGGSHRGYAAFSLDFKRPDQPEKAAGTPFVAGARGRIVRLDQDYDSRSKLSNSLGLEIPGGEVLDYLHFQTRSAFVRQAQWVSAGQSLARVGDVGAGEGNHHLHVAWLSREQRPFVTLPFVFERFQVSQDQGKTWMEQSLALPPVGAWCRASRWGGR